MYGVIVCIESSSLASWSGIPPTPAELGLERVQAVRPERAVALEPRVELGERCGVEGVEPPLALPARADAAADPRGIGELQLERAAGGQVDRPRPREPAGERLGLGQRPPHLGGRCLVAAGEAQCAVALGHLPTVTMWLRNRQVTMVRGSGGDLVLELRDHRLARIDSDLLQDGLKGRAERLELLLR